MDEKQLADHIEIRALVARYCDSLIDGDEKAWASTWTRDCIWELGPQKSEGLDGALATLRRALQFFEHVAQIATNETIEIDGDRATGRWTVQELGWPKERSPVLTLGTYRDEYVRTPEGWRFAARRFRFMYSGPADLSGKIADPS